ncbi:MAG: hypothetical protein LBL66_11125, partial [Clostridiales bacterium]|nr:hypothetical protein [Clostridiales bacterium]
MEDGRWSVARFSRGGTFAQSIVHSAQSTVSVGGHCAGVPLFGRDCRVALRAPRNDRICTRPKPKLCIVHCALCIAPCSAHSAFSVDSRTTNSCCRIILFGSVPRVTNPYNWSNADFPISA